MKLRELPRGPAVLYGAAILCAAASVSLFLRQAGERTFGEEKSRELRTQLRSQAALQSQPQSGSPAGDAGRGAGSAPIEGGGRALLSKPFRLVLPGDGALVFVPEAMGFAADGAGPDAPLTLHPALFEEKLLESKNAVDKHATSARIDTTNGQIKADEAGILLDVFGTMSAVLGALRAGQSEVRAEAAEVPALHRAQDLEAVRFDEVLGYFDTHYNGDAKHQARSYNLKLAASRFDGTVLFPGETFDFNEVVGPRTEAWGYKVAPVISSGELVDGVGGGTCQVAGTLHGAAFFAGLDIVERHPHTRPSFYIKMGLDAAVAYPTLTLRLRNSFSFPVVLVESVRGGVVRAEILGPVRTQAVSFVRKIDEAMRFDVRESPEPRLPRGQRILSQRGVPGFKVTRFRIVREGAFAYRERLSDHYPPTSEVWHVGTGAGPVEPELHDDDHPEYVADDYLSVTQGPDIRSPNATEAERGGGTTEVRVAGRYGLKGWSNKAGAFDRRHKKDPAVTPGPTTHSPHKRSKDKR